MKLYLDGQFVESDDARLSVFDAGAQHGVGLFETMAAYHGVVFRLRDHIDRLIASATELGLTDTLRPDPLCQAVETTLRENDLDRARVRVTITGGDLSMLAAARAGRADSAQQPSVCIAPSEPTIYPEGFFTDGVTVLIADPKANPFDPLASHKTINYWARLRTLMQAAQAGAAEALWFDVTNHLAGGAVSNAFLIKNDQLFTPIARGEEVANALPSPVLPGVTRRTILEVAENLDLPIQRKMLTIKDVLDADELMLTNSSWGVLPVVAVEKQQIGPGHPGPWTQKLYQQLLECIDQHCRGGESDDAAIDRQ